MLVIATALTGAPGLSPMLAILCFVGSRTFLTVVRPILMSGNTPAFWTLLACVADGAIVPTATGSNPVATISALSERVAEGITRVKPDDQLR